MYGGELVTQSDGFSFIVLVLTTIADVKNRVSLCAGTYIRNDIVLTARHCVNNSKAEYVKIYSRLNYSRYPTVFDNKVNVEEIVTYKDGNAFVGDLALLYTKYSVDNIVIGKLPDEPFPVTNNLTCWIMGFGEKGEQDTTGRLALTKLLIRPYHSLKTELRSIFFLLSIDFICYAIRDNGKGPCKGDSGGPLICNGKLYGVLSRRTLPATCGASDSYALYENVYKYRDWINKQIGYLPYQDAVPPSASGSTDVHRKSVLYFKNGIPRNVQNVFFVLLIHTIYFIVLL